MALTKSERRLRIRRRIRKVVTGTAQKPRLSVFRSNKEIYAQLIDDVNQVTLMSFSSRNKELEGATEPRRLQIRLSRRVCPQLFLYSRYP